MKTISDINTAVRLFAASAVFLFCIQTFSHNKADVDLWGNAGFVKALPWQNGFHYSNTYSYTEPARKWINHEWLAEYLINGAYVLAGNPGLITGKILLGMILMAVVYSSIRRRCSNGIIVFFFLMVFISTIGYGFSTRPHLFTYIMLALYLKVLSECRTKALHLIILTAVTSVIWANLHGAFFIGAVILAVFSLFKNDATSSEPGTENTGRAQIAVAFAVFTAFSFINPYGKELWSFVGKSAVLTRPYLSEWAPFNIITNLSDHTDFIALAVVSALSLIFTKKRRSAPMLTALVMAFLSALLMRRNIPLFAITACFIVPEHAASAAARHLERFSLLNAPRLRIAVLAAVAVTALCYSMFVNKTRFFQVEVQQDKFPTDVFRFMKDNGIKGNAIVFFDWAEYAIWHLHPDCRVFMDGRFDSAYSMKSINDYLNFIYYKGQWNTALTEYPTDIAILHTGNPSYKPLLTTPGWTLVYESDIAGLILKNEAHKDFFEKAARKQLKVPPINKVEYFP